MYYNNYDPYIMQAKQQLGIEEFRQVRVAIGNGWKEYDYSCTWEKDASGSQRVPVTARNGSSHLVTSRIASYIFSSWASGEDITNYLQDDFMLIRQVEELAEQLRQQEEQRQQQMMSQ